MTFQRWTNCKHCQNKMHSSADMTGGGSYVDSYGTDWTQNVTSFLPVFCWHICFRNGFQSAVFWENKYFRIIFLECKYSRRWECLGDSDGVNNRYQTLLSPTEGLLSESSPCLGIFIYILKLVLNILCSTQCSQS